MTTRATTRATTRSTTRGTTSAVSTSTPIDEWQERVLANSGSVDTLTLAALQTFYSTLNSAGIWSKILRMNLFVGEDLEASAIPLIVGAGTATETLTNFLAADQSKFLGLLGNGSTKYLDTGFNASTGFTANDTCLCIFTNIAGGNVGLHGARNTASSTMQMYAPYTDMVVYGYQYNQTNGEGRLATSSQPHGDYYPGTVIHNRSSTSSHKIWINGVEQAAATGSGGTLPNKSMYMFAQNSESGVANHSSARLLGYLFAPSLSDIEIVALSDAFRAFSRRFEVGSIVSSTNFNAAEDVLIDGDIAYVACRDGACVTLVDITDPTDMSVIAKFTDADLTAGMGMAVNGNTLFLTSWLNAKLLAIDVSTPASPVKISSVSVGAASGDGLRKVVYRAGYCYCTHLSDGKLYSVDVSDTSAMTVADDVVVTNAFSATLDPDSEIVYCTGFPGTTLHAIDITDPTAMSSAGTVTCVNDPGGVVVEASKAYICGYTLNQLQVMDVANPAAMSSLGTLTTEALGLPNRITKSGTNLIVACSGIDKIAVVDVSNPAAMVITNSQPTGDKPYGIAYYGNYCIVVCRDGDSIHAITLV